MNTAKRVVTILVVLIVGVGCDQATKSVAQAYLPTAEAWTYLGDTLRLQLSHNPGAFLSLGAALSEQSRFLLFSIFSGVLLLGVLGYALFSKGLSRLGVFAMALFFAGGISNLVDRWLYGGYVVDFINIGIGQVRTGIFNVADMLVMAGVVMLLVQERWQKKARSV